MTVELNEFNVALFQANSTNFPQDVKDLLKVAKSGKKQVLEVSDFATPVGIAFVSAHSLQSYKPAGLLQWSRNVFLKTMIENALSKWDPKKREELYTTLSENTLYTPLNELQSLLEKMRIVETKSFFQAYSPEQKYFTFLILAQLTDAVNFYEVVKRKKTALPPTFGMDMEKVLDRMLEGKIVIECKEKDAKFIDSPAMFITNPTLEALGILGRFSINMANLEGRRKLSINSTIHELTHAARKINRETEGVEGELAAYTTTYIYQIEREGLDAVAAIRARDRKEAMKIRSRLEARYDKQLQEAKAQFLDDPQARIVYVFNYVLRKVAEGFSKYNTHDVAMAHARKKIEREKPQELKESEEQLRNTLVIESNVNIFLTTFAQIEDGLTSNPLALSGTRSFYERAYEGATGKRRELIELVLLILKVFDVSLNKINFQSAENIVDRELLPHLLACGYLN